MDQAGPVERKSDKKEVYALIEKYSARREASNSARSAKPLFANIEKEQRDLAIRQRKFKAEMKKAMEKLGDLSVFDKYLKKKPVRPKHLVVEVQPFALTVVKSSVTSMADTVGKKKLFLTEDHSSAPGTGRRKYRNSQVTDSRPHTTKSASSGYKSTPMHLDPRYKFRLKTVMTERISVSSQLSLQLGDVMSKCSEVEQSFNETKRLATELHTTKAHIRHRSLEDITDMLDSLGADGTADNFNDSLHLKRTGRRIDKQVLATAGEVKSSYLASSEFVSRYAHKNIWRYSTLSLTRHIDKLIDSLPVTRGLVR